VNLCRIIVAVSSVNDSRPSERFRPLKPRANGILCSLVWKREITSTHTNASTKVNMVHAHAFSVTSSKYFGHYWNIEAPIPGFSQ